MGVDYSASIVVGLLAEECIKTVDKSETITKYNEDTGEPYEKVIPYSETCLGDIAFEDPYDLEQKCPGLEPIYGGPECGVVAVGACVNSMDMNYDLGVEEVENDKIDVLKKEVAEAFKKIGIDAEPKVYLVGYVG